MPRNQEDVQWPSARQLIEAGYRSTSNRYRRVVRIDRRDWREEMGARHVQGFRGDPEENARTGMRWVAALGHGAGDHYRRCMSRDALEGVPDHIFQAIRKAGDINEFAPKTWE